MCSKQNLLPCWVREAGEGQEGTEDSSLCIEGAIRWGGETSTEQSPITAKLPEMYVSVHLLLHAIY
jgi:hypothetical protein